MHLCRNGVLEMHKGRKELRNGYFDLALFTLNSRLGLCRICMIPPDPFYALKAWKRKAMVSWFCRAPVKPAKPSGWRFEMQQNVT